MFGAVCIPRRRKTGTEIGINVDDLCGLPIDLGDIFAHSSPLVFVPYFFFLTCLIFASFLCPNLSIAPQDPSFTMVFDINSLEPHIRAILSAPGTDLTTISAKRVRKQLLEVEPSLTQEFLKENKEAVDGVIASVFEAISAEMGGVEAASQTPEEEPVHSKPARKRKTREEEDFEDVGDEGEEEEGGSVTPPPKKAKKGSKNGRELSDAELARQLSSEINGRSRRSGGRTRATNGSSLKKGNRKKKSAAMIDSDGDESDDDRKRSKPKKRAGGTAKGGFAKEYILRLALPSSEKRLNFSISTHAYSVNH